MKRAALAAALLITGCDGAAPPPRPAKTPVALEAAAIQAGVIPDPASMDITGLYTRETDRVCIVPSATAYRIGVFIDYDEEQHCAGSGTVTRVGDALRVSLGKGGEGGAGCSFDARFEGDRIVFPPKVPAACQRLCSDRASIAALDVARLSDAISEAATLRDGRGRLLCAGAAGP